MSDRLVSQLADRLELDESDVTPILNALLKQVRQRAHKGSGARVPTLGTFTTDADGTLQFEPEDDLVDAVNADFAGLESEPAPTPKRAPDTSTALAEAPPAPDDASPSPRRSASEEAADASDTADAPDKSATEELPAASTSSSPSFADETEDPEATQELNAPPASSTDPEPADTGLSDSEPADAKPADAPDTGSLWPAEANAPTTPDVTDAAEEHDEDEDDDFWSRDREWDLSSVAFGDESDDEPDDADDALASTSLGDEEDTFSESRAAAADAASDMAADTAADRPATPPPKSPERSGMRTGLGIAVVLAALIGGWIVLGAVGVIPGPGAAVDSIRSSVAGGSETVETAPESTADASDTPALPPSDPSASDASRASGAAPGASEQDATSDDTSTDDAQSTPAEARSAASGIVPAEGGWTLVVASRTTEQEAESIRTQYADALQAANVPVDVLPSEGSDGTTRYRVVVGQFSSQEAVRSLQDEYSAVVPSDAWPLAL